MSEFEVWIYRGVIVVLLVIVWYFAKGILVQLKEMNNSLKNLNDKSLIHDGNLMLVHDKISNHETRINDHAQRLRKVESRQDLCPTCPEG